MPKPSHPKGAAFLIMRNRNCCAKREAFAPIGIVTVLSLMILAAIPFACDKWRQETGSSSPSISLELPTDFPSGDPYFARVPPPTDWRFIRKAPESFDKARKWGPLYDLRQADLGRLDLTAHFDELRKAFFDTETRWPEALPPGFDPGALLDLNRNPGLGLRELHAGGITGKGISVALIDAPLLIGHDEYAARLRFYGEINAWDMPAQFHGPLVTSILAGKTCGVAPEADIYFVGCHNFDKSETDKSTIPNATHYARAIEMLLEVNARLPREKKIRVISISSGWSQENPGYLAMDKAVRKAARAGIFVVSGNIATDHRPAFWFWGLDRASTDSPDDSASFLPFPWRDLIAQVGGRDNFDKYYTRRLERARAPEFLLIPEGSKTVAQSGGPNEYGFYPPGGWSSVIPFIAGLYALACQVKPDVTPEAFWKAALATGDPEPVERDGKTYGGKRVNPARLIENLKY